MEKVAYKKGEDRWKRKFEGDELEAWKLHRENKEIMKSEGIRTSYQNRVYRADPILPTDGFAQKTQKKLMNAQKAKMQAAYATTPDMFWIGPQPGITIHQGNPSALMKATGQDPSTVSPLGKSRLHGEIIRHEIDEAKYMKDYLGKGNKIENFNTVNTLMNSHMDPRVIINESNRMIKAPAEVRNTMTNARRNGMPGTWLPGKAFRMFRPEEKNIQEVLPHFEYGKTYVNDVDAAAVSNLYAKGREARMGKVDSVLSKKIFGGPSQGTIKGLISTVAKRMV